MRYLTALLFFLLSFFSYSQIGVSGVIIGNVLNESQKALEGATVQLISMRDSISQQSVLTDRDGFFSFSQVPFGYYRLRFSYMGCQPLSLDSIHFRAERFDFNLNDIILKATTSGQLNEVVIYAEKPLIQSKEGNITFNAGESALSAGSSADELLTHVPLVSKDPSGKLMIRGKEPKILIDDKPVELNQEQLQDLLESLPGSSIEKIEVLTNPPPQYANEQGGVINIVTKKGNVGKSGRITVSTGTRSEARLNGNFHYRKGGLSLNLNAGAGYNTFHSEGYSLRENIYRDSTNFFRTNSGSDNQSLRPNFRAGLDYEISKQHAVNLVLTYNRNDFDNRQSTEFQNTNRNHLLYKLSQRAINSNGTNHNPDINLTYTFRTRKPGEVFRIISGNSFSQNSNTRDFYQQYLYPDYRFWYDSTQQQVNDHQTRGTNIRLSYDAPLFERKTFLSLGSFYRSTRSDIAADAFYRKRADGQWADLPALMADLSFNQKITNARISVKQLLAKDFSATAGLAAEETRIGIRLHKSSTDTSNRYWSFLPFGTLNKSWKDVLNLTLSYRRTVRRPGIGELNPTVDYSDPYNLRFGNPDLLPSLSDNYDLVVGRTRTGFYANIGAGFNRVTDIFSSIRTRTTDSTTQVTWQNISGRKEYEVSTWGGFTWNKKMRVNLSASYTRNTYSDFDKEVRKFRNGGSLISNMNASYSFTDRYNFTGSFTFNRFANPQGTVGSNLSMNLGLQAKLLEKRLILTLNMIDPLRQQQRRTFTYGSNFLLENYSVVRTRNLRLTASYNLSRIVKKKASGQQLPAAKKPS